jgi:hypothetical protein
LILQRDLQSRSARFVSPQTKLSRHFKRDFTWIERRFSGMGDQKKKK